jgi:hypothetical protein
MKQNKNIQNNMKWQTGYVEMSSESSHATGRKQKRNKKEQ